MRVHPTLAVALLSIATLQPTLTDANVPECTAEDNRQYLNSLTDEYVACFKALYDGDKCTEVCLGQLKKAADVTPPCSSSSTTRTRKDIAEIAVNRCLEVRGETPSTPWKSSNTTTPVPAATKSSEIKPAATAETSKPATAAPTSSTPAVPVMTATVLAGVVGSILSVL